MKTDKKSKKSNRIRIFVPVPPPNKVLVNIKRQREPTQHLTLVGGTLEECYNAVREIVQPAVSAFKEGPSTQVELREYLTGVGKIKNGRSMSFTFYGMNPEEVEALLQKSLDPEKEVLEQPASKIPRKPAEEVPAAKDQIEEEEESVI
jgi:hypothetical protein